MWNLTDENPFAAGICDRRVPESVIKTEGALIMLCLSGRASIEINLQRYELGRNVRAIVLPSSIIQLKPEDDDFTMCYIGCHYGMFHEISNCFDPQFFHFMRDTPCVSLGDDEADYIKVMTDVIRRIYANREAAFRREMARNCMQNVMFSEYNRSKPFFDSNIGKKGNRKNEIFKLFIQLVHQYCGTQREVGFYADKLHVTSRYLYAVVQGMSDETAKDIIDRHVVVEMKIMLKNTNLNIKEISDRMKFSDQSFFGQYFKKHTGMSPLQYREQLKNVL